MSKSKSAHFQVSQCEPLLGGMLQFKDSGGLIEISQLEDWFVFIFSLAGTEEFRGNAPIQGELAGFPHLAGDVHLQFSVVWIVMKSLGGMLQFSLDNWPD
jgi:hypothetical protein